MSFQSMLAGLISGQVSFVVVGGVAGAIHGAERVTNDLDVVYAGDDDTLGALATVLLAWHAYPRGVEKGLPFIMDVRTLRTTPVLTLATSEGDLDLLDRIDGVGDYRAVLAQSVKVEAFRIRFRVLSLPALIKAKRAAGRPKDREALLELELLRDMKRA